MQDAAWLIPPKGNPDPNPEMGEKALAEIMTVAEFSVVYHPARREWMLFTGRTIASGDGGGVYLYTAKDLTGPWSTEQRIWDGMFAGSDMLPYGTFTAPELFESSDAVHINASTWKNDVVTYSVLRYRIPLPPKAK